jgi:hypothetical protein
MRKVGYLLTCKMMVQMEVSTGFDQQIQDKGSKWAGME